VERWGGPGVLEARLRRIDPSAQTRVSALGIEEQRVDAVFDLLSPPEARPGLGDGFAVFLRITAWEEADAVQVTLGALFRQGTGWAVFRAEDGFARLVPVEVGRMNETHAQVRAGLMPGQRVVPHPSDALADGVRITDRAAP
jgi:HlyD family secretion protein